MLMMYRSSSANLEAVNEEPSEETTEETAEPVVGMANPASVYCEEQG
jgi:putative hemolysin